MNMRRYVVMAVFLLASVFALSGRAQQSDPDQAGLEDLRKAGVDLSKPYNLIFFVSFPSKSAAQRAARQIKEIGFNTKVERDEEESRWLCLAGKTMVPEVTALRKIRRELNRIAAAEGGTYESWGGSVK
jgi:hypothetical protein